MMRGSRLRSPCSATGRSFQVFGVASPMHGDLRGGAVDLTEIVRRQLDAGRSDVLLQAVQLRGTRDRYNPRLLRKEPCKSNLGGGRVLPFRDLAEQIDERLIRLERLRREARKDVAE